MIFYFGEVTKYRMKIGMCLRGIFCRVVRGKQNHARHIWYQWRMIYYLFIYLNKIMTYNTKTHSDLLGTIFHITTLTALSIIIWKYNYEFSGQRK